MIWESQSSKNEDLQLLTFYNNFLTQFVHEPTRTKYIRYNFSIRRKYSKRCGHSQSFKATDHNTVQFKLNVEGNIQNQTSNRLNYKKANCNILKEKLENHSVNTKMEMNAGINLKITFY